MSEWYPKVVTIQNIVKHEGADSLSVATVLENYPVIIRTGDFQVGDLACYFPIDTILPDTEDFYHLTPKSYETGEYKYTLGSVPEHKRVIAAKRIRGIYSQGLLIKAPKEFNLDDSIVDFYSLKKFEEENEENVVFKNKKISANAESPPPFHVPYYDIDGFRKYGSCFEDSEEVVITEKMEGSNGFFVHDGERIWCKSRNFFKKKDEDCMWWDIAIRYGLEEKLKKYPLLGFFGEVYGRVKGFKYDCDTESKIRFFDIYDIKNNKYLDYDQFQSIIKDLKLEQVTELYRGPLPQKEELFKMADGKSTLSEKHIREGFVIKPVVNRFAPKLNGRLILKLVGEEYNLQKHKKRG